MHRILTRADYRSMPWKNGGGRTTEIAAGPAGAGPDAWDWRVSVAEVDRDGPFSILPGIDRTIVPLEGAGMRLSGGGRAAELRTRFALHSFRGDDRTECALVAGRTRDFNAMFRRGRVRGSVTLVCGAAVELAASAVTLVYAESGAHECAPDGGPRLVLDAGHALIVEGPARRGAAPIVLRPLAADAVALAVGIDSR